MKRFLNITALKAVVLGVVVSGMATACQNGDGAIGGFPPKEEQVTAGVNAPKQYTDSKQIASLLNTLSEQKSVLKTGTQDIADIQGVGSASGSLSSISTSGSMLTFTGTVSGVVTSDMVTAGLRALVEFENQYGQTLSIWEYRDGSGFPIMNTSEKAQGGYSLTAPALAIPSNVKTIRISLAVWDYTDPSTHYKFLDYQVVTLP